MTNAQIACIGWGSLVWDPRELPLQGGWQPDGPMLPIEFLRESGARGPGRGTRITLVLCPGRTPVRSYWCRMDVKTIEQARRALAAREGIRGRWRTDIGFADVECVSAAGTEHEAIFTWAKKLGLTGAVWTNLPPSFSGIVGTPPSLEEVIAFLASLSPSDRADANKYIRNAPDQIRTPYRAALDSYIGANVQIP